MIISEITKITNRVENIDGEEVYILDRSMKAGMEKLKEWADVEKNSYMLSKLIKDIDFICNNFNFAIALRKIFINEQLDWIPCMVYKYQGQWRRVQLEYANCLKCEWNGKIANPTNPDLYFNLKNEFEVLHCINQLPFCKCPKCGGEVSRKAIWIEKGKSG